MDGSKPLTGWRAYVARVGQRYGATHRRIRREMMAEDPTCRKCGAPGDQADHIKPLCLGGETKRENMQLLCTPCARTKTALEANHVRHHVKRKHLDRGNGPKAGK